MYLSTLQAGQPELIALEKALKEAMVPAGTAREVTVIVSFNYYCCLDYCCKSYRYHLASNEVLKSSYNF